jgi:cytochrome c biogenesis protein CcdA
MTGCLSAAAVGAVLGVVGHLIKGGTVCWFTIAVALVLLARDCNLIRFHIPEPKRQTEKAWAHEFGFFMASSMWGFHIGLGFATRVTYGGFWVLLVMALAVGDPIYGVLLLVLYWLGRAMPLWVMPFLWSGRDAGELVQGIFYDHRSYHRLAVLGLLWAAVVAILVALHNYSFWSQTFFQSILL